MISVSGGMPVQIQRAQTQVLSFAFAEDGLPVAPSSGTINIQSASGVQIVSGGTLTAGSVGTYQLDASLVPVSLTPEEGWTITLTLIANGLTQTIQKDAILVLQKYNGVISESDLLARHSDLRTLLPAAQASWGPQIQAAMDILGRRLLSKGRFPWLIVSPWSLYDVHLNLALSLVFRDLETYTTGDGKYAEMAAFYLDQYEHAWTNLEFKYAPASDGTLAAATNSTAAQPIIFLC